MRSKNPTKKVIPKFVKWIVIVLFSVLIIAYFLNYGIKSSFGFHRIDKDEIKLVILYKFDNDLNSQKMDSLILSQEQINSFAWKWNNSYPTGPYKYLSTFNLKVIMKDGEMRHFRIGHLLIKEKNDYAYRFINDNNFFDRVWDTR